MVLAWMGDGSSKPISSKALMTELLSPIALNDNSCCSTFVSPLTC